MEDWSEFDQDSCPQVPAEEPFPKSSSLTLLSSPIFEPTRDFLEVPPATENPRELHNRALRQGRQKMREPVICFSKIVRPVTCQGRVFHRMSVLQLAARYLSSKEDHQFPEGMKKITETLMKQKRSFILRFKKVNQQDSNPSEYQTCHVQSLDVRKRVRASARNAQSHRLGRNVRSKQSSSGNDIVFNESNLEPTPGPTGMFGNYFLDVVTEDIVPTSNTVNNDELPNGNVLDSIILNPADQPEGHSWGLCVMHCGYILEKVRPYRHFYFNNLNT